MEVWLPILNYETLYQVSSYGNVRSLDREILGKDDRIQSLKGRVLKKGTSGGGYPQVALSKEGKIKCFDVHRLVALHFLENSISHRIQVNHIDGIKTNNHISNLEWTSPRENMSHAIRTGLRNDKGSNHKLSKLLEHQVVEMRSLYKEGILTYKQIASRFNISAGYVQLVINKTRWAHIN